MEDFPVRSTRWAAPDAPAMIEIHASSKITEDKSRYRGDELDKVLVRGAEVRLRGIGQEWGELCEGICARRETSRTRAGSTLFESTVTYLRIEGSATPAVLILRQVLTVDYDYDRASVQEYERYAIRVERKREPESG
jgi:hypothetical protein